MTSAKIRLKVGSMELEYEGDPSFLTDGLEGLLTTMGDLSGRVPDEMNAPLSNGDGDGDAGGDTVVPTSSDLNFSTNTVAAQLEAKSGPELVVCAMAHIELVQKKQSSGRSEILNEMKNATTYYKDTMSKNLSTSLSNLTKAKRINQIAKDTYALSATERKKVEAEIAKIG